MFGHKRVPSREGGIEVVVEELSVRLADRGYEVTCYNRRGHSAAGQEFDNGKVKKYKGIQLKQVFTIQKKGIAAVTSSFFASLACAAGRYEIVHIHAEGPAAFCWIPRLFGKKIVVTVHGLDHARQKWKGFARKYILLGEKNAVRYADEIIVLSEDVKRYFRERYGRETVYIPNGVSRPLIRKADRIEKEWGLKKDSYILFLGRLVPEKGVHYLIEAFQHVVTDKKLVIAGGSSDTEEYSESLRESAVKNEKILFTGFQQGQMLEESYSYAYEYCLPSDLEGKPLSLLEAMSYGNCCLTSDIAECTEVVGDKAVQFQKGNVTDLMEKLQMLCDDREKVEAYKREAADFICGRYNWEDVTERTIEVYRKGLCHESIDDK